MCSVVEDIYADPGLKQIKIIGHEEEGGMVRVRVSEDHRD